MNSFARRENGSCLKGEFYTDKGVFEADYRSVLSRQWHFAGLRSQLPKAGDKLVYELCGESVFVVVNQLNQVRAFLNICRHRGSRLVEAETVSSKSITCPYHGWQYDLDGNLHSAMCMPPGFDCDKHSLISVPVVEYEGMIFVAITENPSPFDAIKKKMDPVLPFHKLGETKIAVTQNYMIRANWKLVIENFLECYHCPRNHPEFCSVYSHIQASAQCESIVQSVWYEDYERWTQEALTLQHPVGALEFLDPIEEVPCVAYRSQIKNGYLTTSRNGEPLAPLLGNFKTYDGGELFGFVGPLFHFSVANDNAILFQFLPSTENTTNATVHWLVRRGSVEGQDYCSSDLTWVWANTFKQDQELVERTQKNMSSRHFRPGPYSLLEGQSNNFIEWYLFNLNRAPK